MKLYRNLAIILSVIFLTGVMLQSPAAAKDDCLKLVDNFIVLFDDSGTMGREYDYTGKNRARTAQEILGDMNVYIPEAGFMSALYSFAPYQSHYTADVYNSERFGQAIDSLPTDMCCRGFFGYYTPLGKGIRNMDEVLSGLSGKTLIIIFSDGLDNGRLDPVAEARALVDKYGVCFLIIAPEKDSQGWDTLEAIAATTDCSKVVDFAYAMEQPEFIKDILCGEVVEKAVVVTRLDSDGDGVYDDKDQCPNTPRKYAVDDVGCPIPISMTLLVEFDFDRSFVRPRYAPDLAELAEFLKQHAEATVLLSGHTDSIGPESYNMGLSERRANSVQDYLNQNHGIAFGRMNLEWFGETQPKATNDTREGRQENRRVKIEVLDAYKLR